MLQARPRIHWCFTAHRGAEARSTRGPSYALAPHLLKVRHPRLWFVMAHNVASEHSSSAGSLQEKEKVDIEKGGTLSKIIKSLVSG